MYIFLSFGYLHTVLWISSMKIDGLGSVFGYLVRFDKTVKVSEIVDL